MRRAILLLLLTVLSGGAAAEWVAIAKLEEGRLYVDPATIRKDGNTATIGTLFDLNKPFINEANDKPQSSQKSRTEYDCKGKRWRMLEYAWFSGNMGNGRMVEQFSDTYKFVPIAPDSAAEILWKIACGVS